MNDTSGMAPSQTRGIGRDEVGVRVRGALATRPLLTGWGVTVSEAVRQSVTLSLPLRDMEAESTDGECDRALVITLADAAGWLSVISVLEEARSATTLEMKVDLVASDAPVRVLKATGEVIRLGRSLATVRSTVYANPQDDNGRKIGLVDATFLLL